MLSRGSSDLRTRPPGIQDVLYHDPLEQNVWRSNNEGKDWKKVDGVPDGEAVQLVEHPSDNQVVSPCRDTAAMASSLA